VATATIASFAGTRRFIVGLESFKANNKEKKNDDGKQTKKKLWHLFSV
jgi:hypothetical protein